MLTTEMLMATLLWPLLATGLVLSALALPAVREHRFPAGLVVALAGAIGLVVGYWGIVGTPSLLPGPDAKTRIPLIVVAALVGTLVILRWPGRRVAFLMASSFAGLSIWLVLGTAIASQWTTTESLLRAGTLWLGMVALLSSTEALQAQVSARVSMTALAALAGLGAPLMLFSDSLVLAQLHAALGISLGLICVITWWIPQHIAVRATHFLVIGVAWSLWSISLLFANTPMLSFVLLAMALPAGLIASQVARRKEWRWRLGLVLITVFALIAASLVVGGFRYKKSSSPEISDELEYGYGYENEG